MNVNIVETLREASISALFIPMGFSTSFPMWVEKVNELAGARTPRQIMDLGDHLAEIFAQTRTTGRSQSEVSGGGAAWESLVCWYLNFCLIGRRTVVIKHNKTLIPSPISDAITVNYNSFASNTESDLVAITFPNSQNYAIDRERIAILDENGAQVPLTSGRQYNRKGVMNALCNRDFSNIEIHVIQCKTNWNDNAQIPMLWDMVYSANTFTQNITIGRNGYSIRDTRRFTYSFVTVPTSRMDGINPASTCVKRVNQISGGNYWGKPSVSAVASSVKEMLNRNLATGHESSHLVTLGAELHKLGDEYSYFRLL